MKYNLTGIELKTTKVRNSLVGEGNLIEEEKIKIHEEDFNDLINFLEEKGYDTKPILKESFQDLTSEEERLNHYEDKTREVLAKYESEEELLDRYLSEIMTEMEQEFKIPILRDPTYEKKHPKVINWYRKISKIRSLKN